MLESGISNVTSAVVAFFALILAVYSSILYFRRVRFLKSRNPDGYFNKVGPILTTFVVGAAVLLIFADSVKGSEFLSFFSGAAGYGPEVFCKRQLYPQSIYFLRCALT